MAARKAWGGHIALAPGKPFMPIEAYPVAPSTKERGAFRKLCACCHKPVDKTEKCPTKGGTPAGSVQGVERLDGSFVVVDQAEVDLAMLQGKSAEFVVQAIEPLAECPLETADARYHVIAPKKQQTYLPYVGWLYGELLERKLALVGKIVMRQRQYRAALYARDGKLYMARLRYASELYDPSPEVYAVAQSVSDNQMLKAQLDEIIDVMPDHLDMSAEHDETKDLMQPIVDRALAGEAVAPTEQAPEQAPTAAPDLLGDLKSALADLEAAKKPKAKPATAKKEVKV